MSFDDVFLELGSELGARLFRRPGSGATGHWGWGENFIAIGTLEGDGCARNVVGQDECRHLISHLDLEPRWCSRLSMLHLTLGAESPRLRVKRNGLAPGGTRVVSAWPLSKAQSPATTVSG